MTVSGERERGRKEREERGESERDRKGRGEENRRENISEFLSTDSLECGKVARFFSSPSPPPPPLPSTHSTSPPHPYYIFLVSVLFNLKVSLTVSHFSFCDVIFLLFFPFSKTKLYASFPKHLNCETFFFYLFDDVIHF
uniref:Uncharacterized protein n=1 Tax=Cacopsylla melanoneura TaxID=428564 RepID=A0A8D8VYV7_9HEMI